MPNIPFIKSAVGIYGNAFANFSIRDLEKPFTKSKVLQTAVGTTTLSSAVALGCRGLKLLVSLSAADVTCSIELYAVINTVDTLVIRWDNVSWSNRNHLFAGSAQGIDLAGNPVKVKVVNPANGTVAVSAVELY